MEEEQKEDPNLEKIKLNSLVLTKSETNIVVLTLLHSKNHQNLIISSHNLSLYSLDLRYFESSCEPKIIYLIPSIYGNCFVLLEMEKSNIILSGHESGSILVFKWHPNQNDLIKIMDFRDEKFSKPCFCLLGFQQTEFIISSNLNSDSFNVFTIQKLTQKLDFRYFIKFEKVIEAICILSDDALQSFACAFSNKIVKIYFSSLQDKKSLKTTELISPEQITNLNSHKKKNILFGSSISGRVYVWDLNELTLIYKTDKPEDKIPISTVVILNENDLNWKTLQSYPDDMTLFEFEAFAKKSANPLFPKNEVSKIENQKSFLLMGHKKWVKYLHSFTTIKNQLILLSSSEDRTIKSWDLDTLKPSGSIKVHFMYIYTIINIQKNGQDLIITGAGDCKIKIWELETRVIRATLLGHEQPVSCIIYNKKADHLISSSKDATIRVWDFITFECLHILRFHLDMIRSVVFLENIYSLGCQDLLVSISDDGRIRVSLINYCNQILSSFL